MRILRLYIINSGVFKKNLIDFTKNGTPQDLICLNGVNGTGKTTIMELIENLSSFLAQDLDRIGVSRKKPNVLTVTEFAQLDILFKKKVISLVLGSEENIQKDKNHEQMFIIEKEIKDLLKKFEEVIKVQMENGEKDKSPIKAESESRNFREILESFFERKRKIKNKKLFSELLNDLNKKQGEIVRRQDLKKLPFVYSLATNERDIFDIRYKNVPKYEFKYEVSHRYKGSNDDLNAMLVYYDYAHSDLFKEIKEFINTSVLVDKKLERVNRPDFKVVIETKDGDEHGLELLSSGEKNLLIIAIQLYLKASKNTIFLIDELDQSLHPEFQIKIMGIIKTIVKKFNSQVIVSSHSRFIWNSFEDEEIIRLTELIK